MTWAEVRLLLSVLDVRETAVCMLATVAGMPPGEIFGLKWRHVRADHIQIEQRFCTGDRSTPPKLTSPNGVSRCLKAYRPLLPDGNVLWRSRT